MKMEDKREVVYLLMAVIWKSSKAEAEKIIQIFANKEKAETYEKDLGNDCLESRIYTMNVL